MENNKEMTAEEFVAELEKYSDECECGCNCKSDKPDYNPITEPAIMDDSDIKKFRSSKEFQNGLKKAAYFSGMLTGFLNSGVDIIMAHDFVSNEIVALNNLAIAEIQKEVAKYNYIAKENAEV